MNVKIKIFDCFTNSAEVNEFLAEIGSDKLKKIHTAAAAYGAYSAKHFITVEYYTENV